MSTLLAIGDSHTFGAEILGPGKMYDQQNKELAWPTKLGKLLNIDSVVNLGESGASIMRTERVLIEYLSQNPQPDLVIIGWTCLGRYEYCNGINEDGDYTYHKFNSWYNPEMPNENYEAYLPIVTADDLLAQKYRTVVMVQQLLKSFNIPYLMFEVMSNTSKEAPLKGDEVKLWSGDHFVDKAIKNMIDQENYIDISYWDYIFDNNEGVELNGGHANEVGHQVWALKLQEELQARNIYGE